jgi:multiple sugar transport system permease protein
MKRSSFKIWNLVLFCVVSILGLLFFLPFLWIILTSFKPESQIVRIPPEWIPAPFTLENFTRALVRFPLLVYTKNTLIVVVFSTLGVLLSSSLVAYSLSRLNWPDRNLLFYIVVATLMIPGPVIMIPVFTLFKNLGWVNTLYPLIVPAFFGNAFFIFLLRQFFMTLPQDLFDAARIDGAGELRCYATIALPLSKPALLTVIIFAGLGAWNDFMGPLIYLSSEEMKTLALGLQSLKAQYNTEWGLLMAASTLMTVPVIVAFFFAQRYFIEGITLTGLKQ